MHKNTFKLCSFDLQTPCSGGVQVNIYNSKTEISDLTKIQRLKMLHLFIVVELLRISIA